MYQYSQYNSTPWVAVLLLGLIAAVAAAIQRGIRRVQRAAAAIQRGVRSVPQAIRSLRHVATLLNGARRLARRLANAAYDVGLRLAARRRLRRYLRRILVVIIGWIWEAIRFDCMWALIVWRNTIPRRLTRAFHMQLMGVNVAHLWLSIVRAARTAKWAKAFRKGFRHTWLWASRRAIRVVHVACYINPVLLALVAAGHLSAVHTVLLATANSPPIPLLLVALF